MKLAQIRLNLRNLSVQMTAIVVALFVFTVVSLSAMSRDVMEAELLEETQRYSLQVLDQVIHNIEYYIGDMENIAQIANKQSELLGLLFDESPIEFSRSTYYDKSQYVQQLLRSVSTMREELANIIVVGENGAMADIRNNYYTKLDTDLSASSWYTAAIEAGGRSVYTAPYLQEYSIGQHIPVISIAKSISMYKGGKPLGVILIELNLDALKKICSTVRLNESGYIFILDKDGHYIYHPNDMYVSRSLYESAADRRMFEDDEVAEKIFAGATSFTVGKGGTERYITSRKLEDTQWVVVGVVPYNEIFAPAKKVGNTQLTIGIVAALAVAFVIAILLSRMVFAPMNRLKLVMGKVERGDLDVLAPVDSDNEIGQFSRGFNVMIRQLKQLMESALQNEKAKRKAELAALHAQINPHFLYNTLDAIVWMAEFNPPEAAEMAQRLAKLFRLALGKGVDIVTIEQEIEYVEHYLSIQIMRYKSKFEYRVECEPEVAACLIPKLVVQVLVENAIYHGIKPKRQKCFLLVKAQREGDAVVVQVVDDGVGVTNEKLIEIFDQSYKPNKAWGGIGVKNVRERLKLYFSEDSGLEYYSVQGAGTLAEIHVPFITDNPTAETK